MKHSVGSEHKKLVLVDGSSYLFRAYHALPPLTNSKGNPTGAVYGVANMLRRLIQDEQPDYIAVIFDTKSKNFRHQLYEAYKANRAEMPDELQVQIAPLHQLIRAMGLPLIAIEGFEADDIIGTLAELATQEQWRTVISTGDKDMAQLVNPSVTLVNTMTASKLDESSVLVKFGVRPDQIVDYLTLVGDPVDNVPGIPKVGPKTAAKWLQEYQTLDNLVEHAGAIKGKVGEYLRENIATLPLSKQLVTIMRDVPLEMTVSSLVASEPLFNDLKALYQELEFKSWLKELEKGSIPPKAAAEPINENKSESVLKTKGVYQCITQQQVFLEWMSLLLKAKWFVIDTETTGLDPLTAEIVGLSLAVEEGKAAYVPVAHDFPDEAQLSREWVLTQLKPILEDSKIGKIGQNLKYDMHILARYGIQLANVAHDTMLESYVYNSVATRHDMDSLAQKYLQFQTITYEEVAGKGAKQISFDKVAIPAATEYAAEDADITLALHHCLYPKLVETPALLNVYQEIELPLVKVLFQMEEYGVCIDANKLQEQSAQIAIELQALESQATILAGEEFNLGSPKQLQVIFYEKLKLPILERTPTGAPSTAESVLQELSQDYDLPKVILAHRTLSKLKSTYTDKLPLLINPRTKRIHTSYHQAVTATGRLSSSDPNLQNIPVRTQEGRKIRQAFIPAPGYVLIAADYSQIELRIMAHLSQDERLLTAFCDGQDIHRFTAAEIFGVPLEEVSFEQRRSAKAINFGLIYGMSAFGLAKQLDIDRTAASAYMEQYFHRYPGVKIYMDTIRKQAEQMGYVETLFGRRLYLPDIRAKNMGRKKAAERTAINAPMQGTAADIIKKAMIALHEKFGVQDDIKMLMQVHDELIFEVKSSMVDKATDMIREGMQNTVQLSVPLIVDIGVGNNWDEAH